ncbi:hypothetical protein GCM10010348_78670 [Streptomyces anthocyanicus]|uniref:DUF6197 family protein n=1 Tax=Streptomyces anthocyanicus TaxID=68174 RepID=UPI0018735C15|nr:hypothetical protein [Streptomyces anthocyanicus]GHC39594.1 hypothetical protein GCM10010348_78670 [Streptomyces anthocyanicus]
MSTATAVRPAPPVLDLDARLALVEAAMSVRLAEAAVAFEVNTAHLPAADPIPHIAEALPAPTVAPSPYRTPLVDLLHRARLRIETDGWCRDAVFDESGAVCPIRAIRLEARGDRDLAHDACVALLDAIQDNFADAETIPSWNRQQTNVRPVLAAFDRATHRAHARNR